MDELQRPMSDDEYEVPKEYQRHSRGTSLPGYSERVSPIKPMAASSSMIRSISPRPLGTIDDMRSEEARIADLERQLAIELKIRAGAESLCRHYAGKKSVDKKCTSLFLAFEHIFKSACSDGGRPFDAQPDVAARRGAVERAGPAARDRP